MPCSAPNGQKIRGSKRAHPAEQPGTCQEWKKLKKMKGLCDLRTTAAPSIRTEDMSDSETCSNLSATNGERMLQNFENYRQSIRSEVTLDEILAFFKDRRHCWEDISWPWMSSGVYYLCKELASTNDFEGIVASARARADFNSYVLRVYAFGGACEPPQDGFSAFCNISSPSCTQAGDLAEYLIWILRENNSATDSVPCKN